MRIRKIKLSHFPSYHSKKGRTVKPSSIVYPNLKVYQKAKEAKFGRVCTVKNCPNYIIVSVYPNRTFEQGMIENGWTHVIGDEWSCWDHPFPPKKG